MCCIPFLADVTPPYNGTWSPHAVPLPRKVSGLRGRGPGRKRLQFSPIRGRITVNGGRGARSVVLPVMARINFNQNTFNRKTEKQAKRERLLQKKSTKWFLKFIFLWVGSTSKLPSLEWIKDNSLVQLPPVPLFFSTFLYVTIQEASSCLLHLGVVWIQRCQ